MRIHKYSSMIHINFHCILSNSMKDLKESTKTKDSNSIIRMYNVNENYKILEKVGRGTYGTVFRAKGLKDNKFYAIKKLQNNDTKLQQEGFPITALRQITILKQIEHPNIIKLKEIILSKPNKRNLFRGSTFLVFQYMDHDFAGLFKAKHKFVVPQIKCIIKQLLEGVSYLHRNKILHRDIKSANILLNDEGDVKLADFGLGRKVKMENIFTYKVVTLWYRAPELLWGCKTYSDRIDVWSVGCVLCQFFTGEVLFRKETQTAQIQKIYELCGDFQVNDIKFKEEEAKNYQYLSQMRPKKAYKKELKSYLVGKCPTITQITIDFIEGLLSLDPSKRLSCDQALRHPFFNQRPTACVKSQIQKQQYACHEMFTDRSIKIQRPIKKSEENESKNYKNIHSTRPQRYNNKDYRTYHHKNQKTQKNINSSSSVHKYSSSNVGSSYSSDKDHHRRSSRENNSKKHHKEDKKDRYYNNPDHKKSYRNDYEDKKHSKYDQKKPYKTQRQKKQYLADKHDYRYKTIKDDKGRDERKDQKFDRKDNRRQDSRVQRRSHDYYQASDSKYEKYERYDKYDKYQEKYDSKGDYYKESSRNHGDKDRNHVIEKEKDYKRRQQVNSKYDLKEKERGYDKYQYKQKYKPDFKGESRGDYKPDYRKQISQKKGDKFIYTRNQRESSSSKSSYTRRNRKERQYRKHGYERKGNYKKQHQSSAQRYR